MMAVLVPGVAAAKGSRISAPDQSLSYEIHRQRQLTTNARSRELGLGYVMIYDNYTYMSGMPRLDQRLFQDQVKMARHDPDYKILTGYAVTCYDKHLKNRIVSVPDATFAEMYAARDAIDRGDSIIHRTELKFCCPCQCSSTHPVHV